MKKIKTHKSQIQRLTNTQTIEYRNSPGHRELTNKVSCVQAAVMALQYLFDYREVLRLGKQKQTKMKNTKKPTTPKNHNKRTRTQTNQTKQSAKSKMIRGHLVGHRAEPSIWSRFIFFSMTSSTHASKYNKLIRNCSSHNKPLGQLFM